MALHHMCVCVRLRHFQFTIVTFILRAFLPLYAQKKLCVQAHEKSKLNDKLFFFSFVSRIDLDLCDIASI